MKLSVSICISVLTSCVFCIYVWKLTTYLSIDFLNFFCLFCFVVTFIRNFPILVLALSIPSLGLSRTVKLGIILDTGTFVSRKVNKPCFRWAREIGEFCIGHTQQLIYMNPHLHPQDLVLVVLKQYSYLCIWMIITTDNYHKLWGLLRSLAEYRFRPLIKFSYAVYIKGKLHTVQHYRLELFSCFLLSNRMSFLNAFRAAHVICKVS